MNRKERRKNAKLNRSKSQNNVVSLFPNKPKLLPIDEMAKDIGFDVNNMYSIDVAYDIDIFGKEYISYDKESATFTIKDGDLAGFYKTFLQCKKSSHAFAILEILKGFANDSINNQREINALGCLIFYMHIRFDTKVAMNSNFNGNFGNNDQLDTILNFHKTAEKMSEEEIRDIFDTVPWVYVDGSI